MLQMLQEHSENCAGPTEGKHGPDDTCGYAFSIMEDVLTNVRNTLIEAARREFDPAAKGGA